MHGSRASFSNVEFLLGGSWGVISGVISRVTMLITYIRGLITPFITNHEPPSLLYVRPVLRYITPDCLSGLRGTPKLKGSRSGCDRGVIQRLEIRWMCSRAAEDSFYDL